MPSTRSDAPVSGIVLAAGDSSRMGRNKLLLQVGGEPVVRRTVRHAIEAGLSPVVVVLGFEADKVQGALEGLSYAPARNAAFDKGINGSVQLGIAHVPAQAPAAIVVLADMPLVTGDMIAAVVERYRETGAPLVISEYDGVRAPPTLYDRSLFAEFTDAEGEGCGKRVVKRHREEAAAVKWPGTALADLDVPQDYERVKALVAEPV